MNLPFRLFVASLLLSLGIVVYASEIMPVNKDEALPYVAIKSAADLKADAKIAQSKQVPVLLFFSMDHCPFCTVVEEDFLKPMLRNTEYESKVIIRKIKIDDSDFVKDFKGESREADEFSDDYNVSIVPTLVLVDANGKMLNPSIKGIRNTHYYSAELDDAIDASIHKIRSLAKR
ncbi:MAG: thioredoxin family protein [Gammaproteobacteria bacterium]|nr:thioredoxin family protein [Gammaproteobacteria bacterium]